NREVVGVWGRISRRSKERKRNNYGFKIASRHRQRGCGRVIRAADKEITRLLIQCQEDFRQFFPTNHLLVASPSPLAPPPESFRRFGSTCRPGQGKCCRGARVATSSACRRS